MLRRWECSSLSVTSPSEPGSISNRLRKASYASLFALLLVVFTFIIRIQLPPVFTDDAYITFRYAENLAEGSGLVFNEGERVLGTTTPLFAISLALLNAILGVLPTSAALWISALADAVTVYLLYRLSIEAFNKPWPGLFAGLLFSLSPLAIRFSINGMETSLAVALILAGLLMYLENRFWAAVLFTAAATLARPEAGLLGVLLVIAIYTSGRKNEAARFAGALIVLLLPWALFATLYFGSPFPHSITAKSGQVYLWSFSQTLSVFLSHFSFLLVGPALGRLVGVPWPGAVQILGPAPVWVLAITIAGLQGFLA